MSFFPLHIFPTGTLSNSVFVCVWVGSIVVAVLNMRFGWPISGLVAPGYLAPLIILRPWIAVTIFIDAIVAYYLSYVLSTVCSKLKYWHSFFGREYFFLIMILSILVRMVFDYTIYPLTGELVNHYFHVSFDYKNNLHSFGIVIIALLANSFWSAGLKRGIFPTIIYIIVSALLVRYVLITCTNYSLANLSHIYTDIATYLDATPKSYIILLVTAFVASHYNLFYGWGYNGILIPSLLALQWYDPVRVLISLGEAGILYLLIKLLVYVRVLKQHYFEGAKRLITFFTVTLIYKIIATYIFGHFLGLKITDFLGFGYLLTTLIAIRIFEKDPYPRLVRSLLQLLIFAVLLSTAIGYALTLIPRKIDTTHGVALQIQQPIVERVPAKWINYIRQQQITLYQGLLNNPARATRTDKDSLVSAFKLLQHYALFHDSSYLQLAATKAIKVAYKIQYHAGQFVALVPLPEAKQMGQYFIRLHVGLTERSVVIRQQADLMKLFVPGAVIANSLHARYYLVGPTSNGRPIKLRHYIKSYDVAGAIATLVNPDQRISLYYTPTQSSYWLGDREDHVASLLSQFIKKYQVSFHARHMYQTFVNRYDKQGLSVVVSDKLANRLMVENIYRHTRVADTVQRVSIKSYLLNRSKFFPTTSGSYNYVAPTKAQLLYLDRQVIKPLVSYIVKSHQLENLYKNLSMLNARAEILGYELCLIIDRTTQRRYLILQKKLSIKDKHFWGTYLFNLGDSHHYIVEIPRPYFEQFTLPIGVELYQKLKGFALLLPDAHPYVMFSNKSDVLTSYNLGTLFTLVHQVLVRETPPDYMVAQIRGYSKANNQAASDEDIILTFKSGAWKLNQLNARQQYLMRMLKSLNYSVKLASGSVQTSGLETVEPAQSRYLRLSNREDMAEIWLSPFLRGNYRSDVASPVLVRQLRHVDIKLTEGSVDKIIKQAISTDGVICRYPLALKLKQQLSQYITSRNILMLKSLQVMLPNLSIKAVRDKNSGFIYLLFYRDHHLAAVARLISSSSDAVSKVSCQRIENKQIDYYLNSNRIWLIFE